MKFSSSICSYLHLFFRARARGVPRVSVGCPHPRQSLYKVSVMYSFRQSSTQYLLDIPSFIMLFFRARAASPGCRVFARRSSTSFLCVLCVLSRVSRFVCAGVVCPASPLCRPGKASRLSRCCWCRACVCCAPAAPSRAALLPPPGSRCCRCRADVRWPLCGRFPDPQACVVWRHRAEGPRTRRIPCYSLEPGGPARVCLWRFVAAGACV